VSWKGGRGAAADGDGGGEAEGDEEDAWDEEDGGR
jgi:hypothetical protein